MPTMTETYNGWTNYATWGVALVLDNDQGTYANVRDGLESIKSEAATHPNVIAKIWTVDQATLYEFADFLKDYVEGLCGLEDEEETGVPEPSLMAQQVIQAGLAEVNWEEIATNIIAE